MPYFLKASQAGEIYFEKGRKSEPHGISYKKNHRIPQVN